jgi:hypothetical protein
VKPAEGPALSRGRCRGGPNGSLRRGGWQALARPETVNEGLRRSLLDSRVSGTCKPVADSTRTQPRRVTYTPPQAPAGPQTGWDVPRADRLAAAGGRSLRSRGVTASDPESIPSLGSGNGRRDHPARSRGCCRWPTGPAGVGPGQRPVIPRRVTVHESRVTVVQKSIELRSYFPSASVDPTEARCANFKRIIYGSGSRARTLCTVGS